jgi:molybdopterin/thiamine biosynthesis adenylyltransferase
MPDRHSEERRTFAHLNALLADGFPTEVAARRVQIVIGGDALTTPAGQVLALTVARLMPRLWHKIDFVCPQAPALRPLVPLLAGPRFSPEALADLARLIWQDGDFTAEVGGDVDVTIGIAAPGDVSAGTSASGAARVSRNDVQAIGDGEAIMAALTAAALVCAEATKLVCPELGAGAVDDLVYDHGPFGGLLDGERLRLDRPVLVGVGAVGCALVYALICLGASGSILMLDPDVVTDSNLMRYILFDRRHLGCGKVDCARELIESSGIDLGVEGAASTLGSYLKRRPSERERLRLVISAVDTYEDRRRIASELPQAILNAGTTARNFTISRHGFADGYACLACLYPARPDDAAEEAVQSRELGLPRTEVAELRQSRAGLTARQLQRIAESRGLSPDDYLAYVGEPLASFYNKEFCAKVAVATDRGEAVAPLAFGSALAGLLLAAGLVVDRGPTRYFKLDMFTGLLRPRRMDKQPRASCTLCKIGAYRSVYTERWGSSGDDG